MIKFGLLTAFFPQTYLFPEFIHWLVLAMYPQRCFVINGLGESVSQVSSLLIQKEFCYPSIESYLSFSEESLTTYFEELSELESAIIHLYLMTNGKQFPVDCSHFPLDIFDEVVRPVLQVLTRILEKEDTVVVDRVVLGMFAVMMKLGVVLDIPTYCKK